MADTGPQHALIIDDDEFMQDLLHEMLDGIGLARIERACDGARALAYLHHVGSTDAPDVLICDLAMPTMDGIEFLRHLAALDFPGGVILLSGTSPRILATAEQLGRAHGLRMLGIMEKPVSLSAMRDALKQFAMSDLAPPTAHPKARLTESEIREGLRQNRITAYFQPKISIASGQMTGVECLARWHDPIHGVLPPSAFIEVAEQAGLIGPITESVFRQAARWAGEWKRRGHAIKTSVNLSMDDLARLDLPEQLEAWAQEAGIGSDCLVLELTESRLMSDQKINLDIITRLRLKGFALSIDDFGTGYSTLDKLKSLPFTELKIDKAFVHGAARDRTAAAILKSSVLLGQELGLFLVAEGVETQEDWELAADLGINEVQGHLIAHPMAAHELLDWKLAWERKTAVDLTRLSDIVGENPNARTRVLEKFLTVTRQNMSELAAAITQGDLETAGVLGRKLKTGARSIGAQKLADACHSLEMAAGMGDRTGCAREADEIVQHLEPVAAYIRMRTNTRSQ